MTRILLATGGTGGHVFPAVAVAEQLKIMGMTPVFITDRRGKPMIPKPFRSVSIMAASPYGANTIEKMKGLTKLAIGALQTLGLMLFYRPKMVVGFGGYPAVAPVLVGKVLRRKTMLHEQNAYFGRANHFLSGHVDKIALSWDQTRNVENHIKTKCIIAGMPVREAFYKIGSDGYSAPKTKSQINILIIGGSLGAEVFGKTVPEALSRLPQELRHRLNVTHQVRTSQIDAVRTRYEAAGITTILAPFIDDMAGEMAKAHLVVCRSGASSVAELAASGRPSILIPFPEAMDDHQTENAKAIVDAKGGWLIPEKDMSAGSLAGRISTLTAAPEKLAAAAEAVKKLRQGNAASIIAKEISTLTGIKTAQQTGAGT
jgi:UDP-N-acetylglucosamine--N-acetylmuramyl-(pentapeptide) pyrophosphoryl-undecaprenol N-acetylglucosamine transferase